MKDNILIVGSGGREHALAWKLSKSSKIEKIFISPGNGGVEGVEKVECCGKFLILYAIFSKVVKMQNILAEVKFPVKTSNYDDLINFCKRNEIKLVVVGPEEHLDRGIVDSLSSAGIFCFGPNSKASKIEVSCRKKVKRQFSLNI